MVFAATRDRTSSKAPRCRVVSRSTRARRASGKCAASASLEPLRAVARRRKVDVPALRARARNALAMSAVMADQARGYAMRDQPRTATRAARLPRARDTFERRREPAPVHEYERLLAAMQPLGDRAEQCGRQAVPNTFATRRHEPHDRRQRSRIRATFEHQALVAARVGVHEALERWRGAAEHDAHAPPLAAPERRIARVIAHRVLLLVRAVVLLVDDDEVEPRHRGEDRQPRAEHDIGRAFRSLAPIRNPLAFGKPAMQRDRARAGQRLPHTRHELRRQVDLGDEHQNLAAACDAACGRAQIHLGLAAAGDAVQQEGRERLACGVDRIHRGALRVVELQRRSAALATSSPVRHSLDRATHGGRAAPSGDSAAIASRVQHGVVGLEPREQCARDGRARQRGWQRRPSRSAQGERTLVVATLRRGRRAAAASRARTQARAAPGSTQQRMRKGREHRPAAAATRRPHRSERAGRAARRLRLRARSRRPRCDAGRATPSRSRRRGRLRRRESSSRTAGRSRPATRPARCSLPRRTARVARPRQVVVFEKFMSCRRRASQVVHSERFRKVFTSTVDNCVRKGADTRGGHDMCRAARRKGPRASAFPRVSIQPLASACPEASRRLRRSAPTGRQMCITGGGAGFRAICQALVRPAPLGDGRAWRPRHASCASDPRATLARLDVRCPRARRRVPAVSAG